MDMRTSKASFAETSGMGFAKKQHGFSLSGMVMIMIGLALVFLVAAKLVPVYIDYFSIKKVLLTMKNADELKNMSSQDLRMSYTRRAVIDNIRSISPADLQIEKGPDGVAVISVDYSVKTSLVDNISLVIDFSVSTAKKD
jgi:hypothetical protein